MAILIANHQTNDTTLFGKPFCVEEEVGEQIYANPFASPSDLLVTDLLKNSEAYPLRISACLASSN